MKSKNLLICGILLFSLISVITSAQITPIVRPLDSSSNPTPNTYYTYVFNFSTSGNCTDYSAVIWTNITNITTNIAGDANMTLVIPDSPSSIPSYLCEFRNGTLRNNHTLSAQIMGKLYTSSINSSSDIYSSKNIYSAGNNLSNSYFYAVNGSLWTSNYSNYLITDTYALNNSIWTLNYTDFLTTRFYALNDSLWTLNFSNFSNVYAMEYNGSLVNWTRAYNGTLFKTDASNSVGAFNQTFDTSTLFIDSISDRVGIGTTVPGAKLDVQGGEVSFSTNTADRDTFLFTTGTADYGRMDIKANTIVAVSLNSNGNSYFNGGNVGIGTTTPNSKLQIHGTGQILNINGSDDTSAVYARFGSSASSSQGFIGVDSSTGGGVATGSTARAFVISGSASGNDLQLASAGTVRMTIDQDGNVGIGTTNPGAKLEVNGSIKVPFQGNDYIGSSVTNGLLFDGTGNYNNNLLSTSGLGIIFESDGGTTGNFFIGNGTGDPDTATKLVTVLQSGNVGIGTTSPQNALNVVGDANATGTVYAQRTKNLSIGYDYALNGTLSSETFWNGNFSNFSILWNNQYTNWTNATAYSNSLTWVANYSTYLTKPTWAQATNGTLLPVLSSINSWTANQSISNNYITNGTGGDYIYHNGTGWCIGGC